jgi:hypothetical protein
MNIIISLNEKVFVSHNFEAIKAQLFNHLHKKVEKSQGWILVGTGEGNFRTVYRRIQVQQQHSETSQPNNVASSFQREITHNQGDV